MRTSFEFYFCHSARHLLGTLLFLCAVISETYVTFTCEATVGLRIGSEEHREAKSTLSGKYASTAEAAIRNIHDFNTLSWMVTSRAWNISTSPEENWYREVICLSFEKASALLSLLCPAVIAEMQNLNKLPPFAQRSSSDERQRGGRTEILNKQQC